MENLDEFFEVFLNFLEVLIKNGILGVVRARFLRNFLTFFEDFYNLPPFPYVLLLFIYLFMRFSPYI